MRRRVPRVSKQVHARLKLPGSDHSVRPGSKRASGPLPEEKSPPAMLASPLANKQGRNGRYLRSARNLQTSDTSSGSGSPRSLAAAGGAN